MSKRVVSPRRPRAALTGINPVRLARIVDDQFEDTFSGEWQLYQRVRERLLKDYGETSVTIASLLDHIDGNLVEAAVRQAGFVVGFEVCRQLLLGDLDLAAFKKKAGAR